MPESPPACNTFWGTHGCDLPANHEPPALHVCIHRASNDDETTSRNYVTEILHPAYEGWVEDGWHDPEKGRWGITDSGYVVSLFS